MNYRFAYSIGFHPWEDAASDPPFVEKAAELFSREEQGREAPFGGALDIGTGSGIWGIELASRGWGVTGIDFVHSPSSRCGDVRRRRFGRAGTPPAHARTSTIVGGWRAGRAVYDVS